MTDTSILEPRTTAVETPEAGTREVSQGTEQTSTTSEQTDDPEKAIEDLKRQLKDRKAENNRAMTWKFGSFLRWPIANPKA